jgi:hypothetical protein
VDDRIRKLIEQGDRLFADRSGLMSLWQEICENFYVEYAEFTATRNVGEDFAAHLSDSYPMIARRTLGNAIGAMLRPANLDTTAPGVWFNIKRRDAEDDGNNSIRAALEWMTGTMRRAMYDPKSGFTRATKEGDHAFAAIGQCVISIELARARNRLLYRSHHVKDVTWCKNAEGVIDTYHRNWKPTAHQLVQTFRGKASPKVEELIRQNRGYDLIECRHAVIPSDQYETRQQDGRKWGTPYVSIWIDKTHDGHVMEEVGSHSPIYLTPRFMTQSASQYGYSPAAVIALPDARLIQAMSLSIMEAGEKMADPPMVGTEDAIKSAINSYAGGWTWVDREYDERIGAAARPLYEMDNGAGMNAALAMRADVRAMIDKAFFLDSLSLPPASVAGDKMTAFEVGERISEWLRRAMPIFEPVEFDYNGGLCEMSFDLMLRNGFFGNPRDLPDELKGADLQFKFESPLHESADRRKGQKFLESRALLEQALTLDPGAQNILDVRIALRDALQGVGVPARWTRDDRQVEALEQEQAKQQALAATLAGAEQAAAAASDLGSAAKSFADARATAQPGL